ncbi:MAG: sigma-70 family RNA polymerase sigma factor [Acidobacteriota bacterium]
MPEASEKSKEITEMLHAWSEGKPEALDLLLPFVYEELHRQARRYLRREQENHTLQPTALINEAYLKLIEQKGVRFESRTHFFAIAANLMRQILVDHARTKHRLKRGGVNSDLPLEEALLVTADEKNIDLIALDEALNRLGKMDVQQARIVELKYFADLTLQETADVLDISTATVKRDWQTAKAWLYREMTK